jgi:trans-aconitate 2-methyltransferase
MRTTLADGGPDGRPLGTAELRGEVARRSDWAQEPAAYHELLVDRTQTLDVWTTEYFHVLAGEDAVLEWVKGTGLRPIVSGLDDGERALFLAEYRRRLRTAYPARADGRTVYPFRRLFIVATV